MIDVTFGLILIAAPYVGRFSAVRPALYTDVGTGVPLLAWAVARHLTPGGLKPQGMHSTHAQRQKRREMTCVE